MRCACRRAGSTRGSGGRSRRTRRAIGSCACWCARRIDGESRQRYGSPRILEGSASRQGERVSRKRVVRLMQEDGLKARVRKRFKCTTMSDHDQPVAANVLDRQFTADAAESALGRRHDRVRDRRAAASCISRRSSICTRASSSAGRVSAVNDRHLTIKALEMALKRRVSRTPGCSITRTRAARTRARTTSAGSTRTASPAA